MAFGPQPYTALAENTLYRHRVHMAVSTSVPVARPAQRGIGELNGTN